MASEIILVTSDDPPIKLSISRAALVTNSRTFADLLTLPSSKSKDGTIELQEREEELKPFLRVIEGKGTTALGELDEEGWETVARLGDKFDSETVKAIVMGQAWKLYHLNSCALHVFTLVSFVNNDPNFLRDSALRALEEGMDDPPRFGALDVWKTRLESYRQTVRLCAFEAMVDTTLDPGSCVGKQTACSEMEAYKCWTGSLRRSMRDLAATGPFLANLKASIPETMCPRHERRLGQAAEKLEKEYFASVPLFPD